MENLDILDIYYALLDGLIVVLFYSSILYGIKKLHDAIVKKGC